MLAIYISFLWSTDGTNQDGGLAAVRQRCHVCRRVLRYSPSHPKVRWPLHQGRDVSGRIWAREFQREKHQEKCKGAMKDNFFIFYSEAIVSLLFSFSFTLPVLDFHPSHPDHLLSCLSTTTLFFLLFLCGLFLFFLFTLLSSFLIPFPINLLEFLLDDINLNHLHSLAFISDLGSLLKYMYS